MITGLTPLAALDATLKGDEPDDAALELAWRLRLRDRDRSRALVASVRDRPETAARVAVFAWRDRAPADATEVFAVARAPGLDPLWVLRALVVGTDFLIDALAAPELHPLCDAVRSALPHTVGLAGPGDLQAVENMLGRVAGLFPERRAEAVAHYERAAQLCDLAGEPIPMAISLVNAASARSTLGDPLGALDTYLRALEVAEEGEAPPRVLGFVHGNIGDLHRLLGHVDDARHHAEHAVALTRRCQPAHLLLQSLAVLARVHLGSDALDDAQVAIEELRDRASADHREVATTLEALWALRRGDAEVALGHLETAPEVTHPDGAAERCFVATLALARLGRHRDAVARLRPYVDDALRSHDPLYDDVVEAYAISLRALGRAEQAVDVLLERARHLQQEPRRRARVRLEGVARDVAVRAARATADDASAQAHALQIQLQRAQRLEAFGQMAAGLAHDFNNALTVVMAAADTLEAHPRSAAERGAIEAIHHATEQAAALTRRLAAVARRSEVDLRVIDLGHHLRASLPMLQAAAKPCALALVVTPMPPVEVDVQLLDQALLNLVLNARDASVAGAPIELRATTDRHRVQLTLRDEGRGIRSSDLQRIFDPFFSTKGDEGTGLGLAMVWGIAQQLGGDVSVSSALGEGTCFTLHLPAAEARQAG